MSMLNPFDSDIISWVNRWAHRSWAFDTAIGLCSSYLFRVAGIVPVIWWAWFRRSTDRLRDRQVLMFGLIACMFSLFIARMISRLAPFRVRPLRAPGLHFVLPYGQNDSVLLNWSSFPSDHAAVYFTLATSIYLVSKKAGVLALTYALIVTCFPRLYLGLHYPTDILAGIALGGGVAYLSQNERLRNLVTGWTLNFENARPGTFYALLFLYSLQLATAFESIREFFDYLVPVTRHAVRLLH